MSYSKRYVSSHFWDDNYIVELDPIEKLMFLYFLTNPLTRISGFYEISLKRISFDTGIDKEMVLKVIDRFSEAGKIYYQDGYIVIPNFPKKQCYNPNMLRSAMKELESAPEHLRNTEAFRKLLNVFETLSNPSRTIPNDSQTLRKIEGEGEVEVEEEVEVEGEVEGEDEIAQSDMDRSEPPTNKPIFKIPLIKGKNKQEQWFPVYQKNIDDWQELYPAVDVENEIRKLVGWNISHPNQRKTPRGILRHIHYWLGKEQDKSVKSAVRNKSPTQDEYLFSEAARKTLIAGKQWLEETGHDS